MSQVNQPWSRKGITGKNSNCWRALARQHTILFSGGENPKIFRMEGSKPAQYSIIRGIETTITRTSHGCHILRVHFARGNLTYAVTARKQILIKFSFMEKSVSGFIWAADKETLKLIIFEPWLVLFLLFSRSSLNYLDYNLLIISRSPRTVILAFYL